MAAVSTPEIRTSIRKGAALSYTHSFTSTLVNEARIGFNREHTSRVQPSGTTLPTFPRNIGIQGVPQTPGNGGLPYLGIGSLSQLGSAEWLVSDRYSNTIQFTENLTKVYRSHTFKGGFELQSIYFPGSLRRIHGAVSISMASTRRFQT